jgi:hypothetical protein
MLTMAAFSSGFFHIFLISFLINVPAWSVI